MSTYTTTWKLDFDPRKATQGVKDVTENLNKATKSGNALGDCFKRLKAIDLMAIDSSVQNIKDRLQGLTDVANSNESALAEVSAITGNVGKDLEALNTKAKNLSKTYGEDLNVNLDSFKTILSRLGPDMGKSDAAMEGLGESVNVLSKGMEGDIKGATDAITTSMLQFQVDLKNPVKAAEESKRMINVMAAGAKEGAAEIPQISQALVQAGVSAKLANLSFEETNSSIQAMAEGGKYGSEAGVAIRNVITNMSASTKLTDTAAKILKAYGIDMKKVSDTSVPWAERLKALQPIQQDINALTEVFGRENASAAQILIRSAQSQEELTKKITGTNVAYQQAAVIMDTEVEKEKRRNQRWNLFALEISKVTSKFQPYINVVAGAISITANLKNAYDGLKIVMNAMRALLGIDTILKWFNANVTKKLTKENLNLFSVNNQLALSMIWASLTTFGMSAAMQTLKTSINSVSMAILKIPVIGWIIALIAVLAAAFIWLWNNVGEFRGFFYGIWEVIKLAFSGIWEVIKVIINLIAAYFKWWLGNIKMVFNWVVKIVGDSWNWVAQKFSWAWTMIKTKSEQIWNKIKAVFAPIKKFFQETFGSAWDIVSSIFDKIWNKIKGFMGYLEPLGKALGGLWDKIKGAGNKGMEKGIKEVDDEKREKAIEEGLKNGSLVEYNGKVIAKKRYDDIMRKEQSSLVDPSEAATTPTKTIDYDKSFAKKDKKKKGKGEKDKDGLSMSGSSGPRTINMTVNVTNQFSAAKQQAGDVANKVVGQIVDRLRDGMVAID